MVESVKYCTKCETPRANFVWCDRCNVLYCPMCRGEAHDH